MHFARLLTVVSVLIAAAPAAEAGNLAARDKMVPHKALYDIEMVSKRSSSQIINISGKMFYEWKPGCDAWTTDHRFNLFYEYADSPPIRITSDFSTYETFDGKSFDFTSRRKRNGELYQEIRGRAELGENGGEASYTLPEGLVFDLKKKTQFPMAHSLEILARAAEGKKLYNAIIFDGSDEEGPVEVNAFIGDKIEAVPAAAKAETGEEAGIDKSLLAPPAWKVRMAFFPLLEPTSDAEYEMDVVFHQNGVISDMLVEYRDFSVTQKLAALEKLEAEKCDAITKN